MTTEEYMKATKPAVDFLMNINPLAATLAQAEGDTAYLIEMLEDVVKEAQQHIDNLKARRTDHDLRAIQESSRSE